MFHRPASRFRHRQRFSANLPAHLLHIVPEILQQNAGVRQKAFQPHHVGQHPQRAAKTQPIPSAEHPNDKTGVTLYKAVHGVAPLLAVKASHLYFTGRANASFILLVAAEGRAKSPSRLRASPSLPLPQLLSTISSSLGNLPTCPKSSSPSSSSSEHPCPSPNLTSSPNPPSKNSPATCSSSKAPSGPTTTAASSSSATSPP